MSLNFNRFKFENEPPAPTELEVQEYNQLHSNLADFDFCGLDHMKEFLADNPQYARYMELNEKINRYNGFARWVKHQCVNN